MFYAVTQYVDGMQKKFMSNGFAWEDTIGSATL